MVENDSDRRLLFSFFAALLWQDGSLHVEEHEALALLADELEIAGNDPEHARLHEQPPELEEVDPQRVPRRLRNVVLELGLAAVSVRPSFAKYEALELLEMLLPPPPPRTSVELAA